MDEVHVAVTLFEPADEVLGLAGVVGEVRVRNGDFTRIEQGPSRGDDAFIEGADGRCHLEGRTRGEFGLDGVVHEWIAPFVALQILVVVKGDKAGQPVVLIGWQADHGQDFTGLGVDSHHDPYRHPQFGPAEGVGPIHEIHPVLQRSPGCCL